MLLVVALLLACAVGVLVGYPLLRPESADNSDATEADLAALELRKQAKYREIRDAEQDFQAGKLSEDDYRGLDRELRAEAIAILEQIDRLEGKR